MQMLNHLRNNHSNNKNNNKFKKSQILLLGSLLIFCGSLSLLWNYLVKMRDTVYSEMKIAMMDDAPKDVATKPSQNIEAAQENNTTEPEYYEIDYSKYLGVLEIPKIGLKRGFYNIGSKYNNINYNVTVVDGTDMPDIVNGNFILMAHSGDSYISYFAYLYKLTIGDMAYITYAGNKYAYQVTNIYEVEKNGAVRLVRNKDRTTLTLITCTKDNDYTQTVYIAELVG